MAGWRRAGYAVNVWTVDDADEVRRLARLGVDAIISNDPAAARAAMEAR
jgi:glycerophosphoryl diester phosphodiesterase